MHQRGLKERESYRVPRWRVEPVPARRLARWIVLVLILGGCAGMTLRAPLHRHGPWPPPIGPLAYGSTSPSPALEDLRGWMAGGWPSRGEWRRGGSLAVMLDCTRLPLPTRQVLSLILLLPLAALVTAVFRTIIGAPTFGTFTPALLALSFVGADWRSGVFVFGSVVVLGLTSRTLLEHLRLLLVPRLSIVLTLVVLCTTFSISLLDHFHFTPSAQTVLLPMIVMTMTVERCYVTAEEEGLGAGFRLMASTALVAFCCYGVLQWEAVGRSLLAHPEAHLFTLAILILLGRYTGYRLTELWRFRMFRQPKP